MSTQTHVRDLMISNVQTISQSKTIFDAVQLMISKKIGALIVVDDAGHTAGIFTERDLLTKVVGPAVAMTVPLSQVMTKDLVCAQLHDDFATIPDLMIQGGFRHVPVVDGFVPVGILSVRDVLRYYAKK